MINILILISSFIMIILLNVIKESKEIKRLYNILHIQNQFVKDTIDFEIEIKKQAIELSKNQQAEIVQLKTCLVEIEKKLKIILKEEDPCK